MVNKKDGKINPVKSTQFVIEVIEDDPSRDTAVFILRSAQNGQPLIFSSSYEMFLVDFEEVFATIFDKTNIQ